MGFPRDKSRWLLLGPLLLISLLALVACGGEDEDETVTDPGRVIDVSPQAVDELPEDTEMATLEIADGAFVDDELLLLRGEPTILHVTNRDDQDYQFRIEGFVIAQAIPAESTTEISFTTPTTEDYTGELLDAEDDSVLDDIRVVIQPVTGADP
jgi:hypothetical protein